MAPNRKLKTAKAKAKKQKVLAIGGAVLLIAILAYEIPNTMKLMSPSKSAATTTTTTRPVRKTAFSRRNATGTARRSAYRWHTIREAARSTAARA